MGEQRTPARLICELFFIAGIACVPCVGNAGEMSAEPILRVAGQIVDLHACRVFPGVVECHRGRIVRIIPRRLARARQLIMPGFIDAHVHIESSLLPPAEFARLAVVHGTVATVSDPHEIANILGVKGVDFMVREGKRVPLVFNFGAPSCVPATEFETAGARLRPPQVGRLLARREIGHLSEVMNFPAVLAGAPGVMAMMRAAKLRRKPIDGHAPGLRGAQARAYAARGPATDHECCTLREARDKLAAGMRILIREGSAARNFAALAPLLRTQPACCMLCCDDVHPDLLLGGHIDRIVRRALAAGADRFEVLRCASLNPVEYYQLSLGLLREGDPADFIVVDDWKNLRVLRTYLRGRLVAANGRTRLPHLRVRTPNRFRAAALAAEDLAVVFRGAEPNSRVTLNVIGAMNGQISTKHCRVGMRLSGVEAKADPARDLLKIAVINRYRRRAPASVGFIRGFGLRTGAIASSVAHDSHNIVVVGADDQSMARAANLVIRHRGGLSVSGPLGHAVLPLPIAGLMSDRPAREVARRYIRLDRMAKQLGSQLDAPFMTLSFMALLVIPQLKMSDRGLFSTHSWGFVPLRE